MFRFSRITTVFFVVAILAVGSSTLLASVLPVGTESLALWYDADAITGQGGDYTPLATWEDLSGNGYDLTQSNESNQPMYRTDVGPSINGKPTVQFDGTNDWMKTGTFSTALAQADHAFLVLRNNVSGDQMVFDEYGPNTTYRQILYFNGVESGIYAGNWQNADFDSTSPAVHEVLFNGASSLWAVNGTTAVSGDAGSGGMASLLLGANGNNGLDPSGRFFNGVIAEIIFFDRALNSWERNQIGDYLGEKWGISTSYVPEPSALALLSIGLVSLLAYAWRKRR